jgi:hypothetical protein
MLMKRIAMVLVVMLPLVFAPSVTAKPTLAVTRLEGLWVTTDCLTGGPPGTPAHTLDCDGAFTGITGDASVMSLAIGPGATPAVRFVDTYATYCVNNFDPGNPRYVATGQGVYATPPETEARTLIVSFSRAFCGSDEVDPPAGSNGLYFCCQENSPSLDNLWDDVPFGDPENTDWGILWVRAQ